MLETAPWRFFVKEYSKQGLIGDDPVSIHIRP